MRVAATGPLFYLYPASKFRMFYLIKFISHLFAFFTTLLNFQITEGALRSFLSTNSDYLSKAPFLIGCTVIYV